MQIRIVSKIILVLLVFCSIFSFDSAWAKKTHGRSGWISARSAIFSNSTAGVRYYGKNVHLRVLPASTTKVMTALLVLERLPLDRVLTVSARATRVQPTTIALKVGEQFTVRDLLFAVLMKSANDASIVLAEAVAGSETEFVRMMNNRARELGAVNTRFANSNGLPTPKIKQYTSAYDMYLIFRKAIQNDFFRRVLKLRYHKIVSQGGRTVLLKTHNKILMTNWNQKVYGKTGYTRGAKQCFVGYIMKGNELCIISVFGCSHRWKDIKYIIERYSRIDL